MFNILEPVQLLGEGEYNLNEIKKITVTKSFLGMDRDCKNEDEPVYNCTTKNYIDACIKECGCLPLSISLSNEVG